ncbi:carboxypeptidase regulatory-like domain-containing protein (plasmid) [Nostoc sp. UHCC 0926]|uniref:carboxypeptidase regulatory-like domain-containing protein n=1 Tax=Nostoc sp. UHCC 0926 TaxID=3025190 RepID=UPI00235FC9EA|nr:carboxypeptidase regulatory-like domain-containing protein [Nostoc sp. UHCC 0926]WDD36394.1 carboxypeptidase regulatory-like domain-containing protein [Nostoc sp. UHCC 0926]
MVQWQLIRHQVVIAGQVINAQTKKAIAKVEVMITKAPDAFTHWLGLKSLQHGDRSPYLTRTAFDGYFHFWDLPEGEYTLTASLPNAARRYGTAMITVTVPSNIEGKIIMTAADMELPITVLKGNISNQNGEPVFMAKVRVKGSTESTFSNDKGQYSLIGLESSEIKRIAIVSAQGYQPTSQSVVISHPSTDLQPPFNFILQG